MKTLDANNRPTEYLKNRKNEIEQEIIRKQKLINRHRRLLIRLDQSCSKLRYEYKIIDRTIFLREHSITKIVRKNREEKRLSVSVDQNIENLSEAETSMLLKQLLTIRAERQRGCLQKPSGEKND